MQNRHHAKNTDPFKLGMNKTENVPLGNGQYYLFQTRKRSQKLLKFVVKGHGYTLKNQHFCYLSKICEKRGGGTLSDVLPKMKPNFLASLSTKNFIGISILIIKLR